MPIKFNRDTLLHARNRTLAKMTYYSPLYFYRKWRAKKEFRLNGVQYGSFYNHLSWRSERCAEIGLAKSWLDKYKGKRVLEVGNTTHFYFPTSHDIIDKYDHRNGCLEIDLFDYNPSKRYDMIFSISTLEHVGWDEKPRQAGKFLPALEKLRALLNNHGILLFTVPIGYNSEIDQLVKNGAVPFEHHFLKRVSQYNEWQEVDSGQASMAKYGRPYLFGNVIMVGSIEAGHKSIHA